MTHKGRIVFAVALTTLGLGLTACNDGEDSATTKESPSASAPASPDPSSESPSEGTGDDAAAPAA